MIEQTPLELQQRELLNLYGANLQESQDLVSRLVAENQKLRSQLRRVRELLAQGEAK